MGAVFGVRLLSAGGKACGVRAGRNHDQAPVQGWSSFCAQSYALMQEMAIHLKWVKADLSLFCHSERNEVSRKTDKRFEVSEE